ncbi:hypothetical protein [Amycolatopsis tucumanensis]|uniref:Dihydroorotate dehydrogenase electron transfer subunit iron-sulphur cluster binding domain-containing protein n=1 Tax=Amycolatopsis tucumanensis TaxID=401106 RepID=A0ABP7HSX6_9PSEU|nr:hypothetical protein [Amycolatopsis tucumanensis]MCF6422051.1 hypothetical protein [Amycolatopsis tucumanensis]
MLGVDVAERPAAPCRPDPFVVVGKVNGRDEAARVGSPAEALSRMLGWLAADADASAVWYLREDWPGPVTVIGRPAPGTARETRRCAHLFPLEPGTVLRGALTAGCGARLRLPEIEWLPLGAGMPCEHCLATAGVCRNPRPLLEGGRR